MGEEGIDLNFVIGNKDIPIAEGVSTLHRVDQVVEDLLSLLCFDGHLDVDVLFRRQAFEEEKYEERG